MKWTALFRIAADGLNESARRQAQWELDACRRIFTSRRRMLLLAAVVVLTLGPALAMTAFGDQLPDTLGGRRAYMPARLATEVTAAAIVIGLVAGLITGCIGAGGGFVITPAMMSAGVKGIMAVGTDMFHIFAKAIMGAAIHRKMGNVSTKLALTFVIGSAGGVTVGAVINRGLYNMSPGLSNAFIGLTYAVLLGFLGFYALLDFLRLRRRQSAGLVQGATEREMTPLARSLQCLTLPPRISFDECLHPPGQRIWAGFVVLAGFFVGFVASIMGVGGGFLTFPMFVYGMGVSEATTVGTDILQIIFTAGYASVFQYAAYGYIFYSLAMGLLLGSLLGVQIGSFTSKVVPPLYIRGFYAMAILAGFSNRLMALPRQLSQAGLVNLPKGMVGGIDVAGQVIFFAALAVFAIWVIGTFFANFQRLRET